MARGKPIVLETRTFASQKEATDYFKELLNRYKPKQRISEVDAHDVNSLLTRHSEYQDKVGVGIDHFEVMSADFGTQCFRLVRIDGSGEDFSYLHCISQHNRG